MFPALTHTTFCTWRIDTPVSCSLCFVSHRDGHVGVDKVADDDGHGRVPRKELPHVVLPPKSSSSVTLTYSDKVALKK